MTASTATTALSYIICSRFSINSPATFVFKRIHEPRTNNNAHPCGDVGCRKRLASRWGDRRYSRVVLQTIESSDQVMFRRRKGAFGHTARSINPHPSLVPGHLPYGTKVRSPARERARQIHALSFPRTMTGLGLITEMSRNRPAGWRDNPQMDSKPVRPETKRSQVQPRPNSAINDHSTEPCAVVTRCDGPRII